MAQTNLTDQQFTAMVIELNDLKYDAEMVLRRKNDEYLMAEAIVFNKKKNNVSVTEDEEKEVKKLWKETLDAQRQYEKRKEAFMHFIFLNINSGPIK